MTTNVFYAGRFGGTNVVSIFTNPAGQTGSNTPLSNPTTNLNRILFDTRFDYLNIVYTSNFVRTYNFVDVNRQSSGKKGKSSAEVPIQGDSLTTVASHGLGYIPGAILVDFDTREAISGNSFIQNEDNASFRFIYLFADENNFYIKEKYFVRLLPLPSLTRRYTIYAFNNPATVPSF